MNPQDISQDVFLEKYAKGSETTHDEVFARVAGALAQVEAPERRAEVAQLFLNSMKLGGVGAGRIMSAAGAEVKATLINCFVQPVGDCIQDLDEAGRPGIFDALKQSAETMRRGGGVGYDFSPIRPRNAFVKGTHSMASGPCSFIDIFAISGTTVESAGSRRGAQMGVLRVDHPDIIEFITAKRTPGRWASFNVSVAVTDEFMLAVSQDLPWELVHQAAPSQELVTNGATLREDGKWIYQVISAKELWDTVMRSCYEFAEPGVVFITRMNSDNNLRSVEEIRATNPCGEQPLPDYGCCDLGPILLPKLVSHPFGFTGQPSFDVEAFKKVVRTQVRMLDNVLDVTLWPLPEQKAEAEAKRRIGNGYTGLGDALTMMNLRYDSAEGRVFAAAISRTMQHEAYLASVDLAIERGAFPLFNADQYLADGTSASRLPDEIKQLIREHGIRNSHLCSIAPVGTISLAFCDNTTNGIEPAFDLVHTRKKRMPDGSTKLYEVENHAFRVWRSLAMEHGHLTPADALAMTEALGAGRSQFESDGQVKLIKDILPASFVTAMEMSAVDHLEMMGAVQPFIDSAISKTVNVPVECPFDEFKDLYSTAWKLGLKGVATYRPNSIVGSVLVAAGEQAVQEKISDVNPLIEAIDHRPDGDLPAVSRKVEYFTAMGKKSLYLSISFACVEGLVDGNPVRIERPVEFFLPKVQDNESQQWAVALFRGLSLIARENAETMARVLQEWREVTWDRGPVQYGKKVRDDGSQVRLVHESEVAMIAFALQDILKARGFLDADGNVVPFRAMANQSKSPCTEVHYKPVESPAPLMVANTGKKCHECGAPSVVRRSGCDICLNCNTPGSC